MQDIIYGRACELANAGIAILPIQPHDPNRGDKRPAISWKRLQTKHLTDSEIDQWFKTGQYGIGAVMGETSGGLMLIELEGRAADQLPELTQAATSLGAGDLWRRMFGWTEKTPSGGYHWYVYAPDNKSGNRKLAHRPATPKELEISPKDAYKVLAETRENGGYSVMAPLDGERFHHTGEGAWGMVAGSPATAGVFTNTELETLLSVFRTIDQKPTTPTIESATPTEHDPRDYDGVTPGDDFENQTSWSEILTPHGWKPVYRKGNEIFWVRPGKTTGVSASTGHANDRDRLYVWSTSTEFDPETPYNKFGAYALLEHAGDYNKAAKALAAAGYGKQAEHPRDTTGLDKFINQGGHTPQVEIVEPDIYTRTDDGNALRFTDTHHNDFKYIPEHKTWAHWDGHKWDIEGGDAAAIEAARSLARNLPTDDKTDQNHKKRSLSNTSIRAMLALARNTKGIYTPITKFDANPYALNTPAGVVNLKTGKLTPPNPKTLCLRSTTTTPDWNMPTPRWHTFLDQTFISDTELITYIQRLLGLTIIGETLEQILPFMHGTGANGKTTMLNVIQNILGTGNTGYTTTSPAEILMATNRHPTEIAALSGIRLSVISELEEGQRIAEAKTKELSGGDNITARFMGKDFFTFKPTHSFIVLTNNVPETNSGGSPALWRRIKKIPFLNTVPKNERNPNLEKELMEEAPGILAWIIDGTINYLGDGLREPVSVQIATSEYESQQNTVAQWVNECCDLVPPSAHTQILANIAYDEYAKWCKFNAIEPVSRQSFGIRIKRHGVETLQSNGKRFYAGLLITNEITDLDETINL